ncbi:hypothetical protein ACFU5O_33310 [Streptomyces sp. NPDC057445]|uniref:hypothetical protein n=1 Tax=Streptomyces sp. NPDC057445 TaxID=3346136 RepID=UPI0036B3286B
MTTEKLRWLPLLQTFTKERRCGRHRRSGRLRGRRHRRLLAYREVEFMQSVAPEGNGGQCLLLVHIRRVVGQVRYQVCGQCAEGVITGVVIGEPFHDSGLGTRALSHLRARYPAITWRSTLEQRLTRDLLRRMRIRAARAGEAACSHVRLAAAAHAGS